MRAGIMFREKPSQMRKEKQACSHNLGENLFIGIKLHIAHSTGIRYYLNPCYLPYQEIYLAGSRRASTESCNSFPSLLWELSRQNYLAVASVWLFTVVVVRKYPVVGSEAKAERVAEM